MWRITHLKRFIMTLNGSYTHIWRASDSDSKFLPYHGPNWFSEVPNSGTGDFQVKRFEADITVICKW